MVSSRVSGWYTFNFVLFFRNSFVSFNFLFLPLSIHRLARHILLLQMPPFTALVELDDQCLSDHQIKLLVVTCFHEHTFYT